jgi:cupin fold WbuC family metalloprotein
MLPHGRDDAAAPATPAIDGLVRPAGLREVAPGIFYGGVELMVADRAAVEFLKEQARANRMRRARICAHPDPDAEQHDMLIASHRETYVAPHRHPAKSESFLVIEGEADILLFEPDGRLASRFTMGACDSHHPFFYRMPAGRYHSLDIRSELLVFAESTKGPFRPEDTENAPWAPAPRDLTAGRVFIAGLRSPE